MRAASYAGIRESVQSGRQKKTGSMLCQRSTKSIDQFTVRSVFGRSRVPDAYRERVKLQRLGIFEAHSCVTQDLNNGVLQKDGETSKILIRHLVDIDIFSFLNLLMK